MRLMLCDAPLCNNDAPGDLLLDGWALIRYHIEGEDRLYHVCSLDCLDLLAEALLRGGA